MNHFLATLIKGIEALVSLRTLEKVNEMAKFKLIISDPATGKSSVSEVEGARAQALVGRSLGETVDGSAIGISHGKLQISGGCDKNGIPMRLDVHGGVKKYIVLSAGPGFKARRSGERRRKLVRGRTITDETYQINFTSIKREAEPKPKEQVVTKPKVEGPPKRAAQKPSAKKPAKKAK